MNPLAVLFYGDIDLNQFTKPVKVVHEGSLQCTVWGSIFLVYTSLAQNAVFRKYKLDFKSEHHLFVAPLTWGHVKVCFHVVL